ncbi:MFS transporter [Enterovibrio norvegicus FF-33]|uniref:cytochrome-c oxidase n=1 Tax=Enterovibrio norvegicus FF-454 TaxID=1185651 RepID=A0A1E5CFQ9_9GAMM|nr:cytochrome c oxidase subunit 3 [Enterovibrio norvegicus]OEE64350.1 MFS transporter [Enterovibrio norvegicus FF-454]OEE68742.1 MFS transporter [Enterovibrio norvegicus FF-33]OEE82542.1 MFS transporter [Enterovibrio norvegicus FF-162]
MTTTHTKSDAQQDYQNYYVPAQSKWPIIGAVALFLIATGSGSMVAGLFGGNGPWMLLAGVGVLFFMLTGWFRDVIHESMGGLYSPQMDRSFRQGMSWFIFSEVMFFAAFFGALFYVRFIAVPWLGGASNNAMTAEVLWPDFIPGWPLEKTPGGTETTAMGAWGLPLINTVILLTSSVTLHLAHVAMEEGNRKRIIQMLGVTVLLGWIFLFFQGEEYIHAYEELNLRLESGVYGNTFFLLTGFHGMHVFLGSVILFIVWLRVLKGHMSPDHHFAFQAGAWYWHFVDVVWLCLFVFVYIL